MDDCRHINLPNLTMDDLKHLADCDDCAAQLADYVEAHGLLTAPKGMKETILDKSRSLDLQPAVKNRHISKRRELFYYSLKVGFAAAFAITMLMVPKEVFHPVITPQYSYDYAEHQRSFDPRHEGTQRITDILNDFKHQLFQMEGSSNDK